MNAVNSPKSTSASVPGRWAWGTITSTPFRPSSTRRRATYRDTVTSASAAPCSATSRCQIRRAVCRCLRGSSRSAINQPSITSAHASIAGLTRRAYGLRGGGTALTNAARTARRCTRCRSASSRIDSPSTRRSRRIRSNSSTRDRTPADPPADRNGQEDHKQGGANIRADTPTPPPDSAPTRWGQISRRFRPPPGPDQVTTLSLPFTQLYRQMFNKELYLLAYGNIYSNQGAMTPGAGAETADGMSEGKIDQIVEAMRHERYRFSPARRVYIPKKNGKLRPLGMPSWSDKLVGEAVRLLLEAIYEPRFSNRSHGFRKGRGCHTALREIHHTWSGTTWFVEGDISDCFGSLDHEILLGILAETIQDQRFLRLIRNMLKAGYLEDWEYHDTLSGCPQGGVVSPILSNIYLDKLDKFVEQELIPQYTQGALRVANPAYRQTDALLRRARRRGDRAQARHLMKQMRTLPSTDPMHPGYRRLHYLRYADDHLLGFTGPKAEAEQIKARLAQFLRETLGLELNDSKTLISHARTQPARFLGYDIVVQHSSTKIVRRVRRREKPM